ncbi:hypothetical protein RRG08_040466 [Elysia crispata]|uniref:Uncharacterized protein n=1 Tax=Elysia crispata TaxID=231223 RepID=A0AAE0ZEK1_9GAST|nr:hypothetical protein RRG08_040466 [Elysia crispata]
MRSAELVQYLHFIHCPQHCYQMSIMRSAELVQYLHFIHCPQHCYQMYECAWRSAVHESNDDRTTVCKLRGEAQKYRHLLGRCNNSGAAIGPQSSVRVCCRCNEQSQPCWCQNEFSQMSDEMKVRVGWPGLLQPAWPTLG